MRVRAPVATAHEDNFLTAHRSTDVLPDVALVRELRIEARRVCNLDDATVRSDTVGHLGAEHVVPLRAEPHVAREGVVLVGVRVDDPRVLREADDPPVDPQSHPVHAEARGRAADELNAGRRHAGCQEQRTRGVGLRARRLLR
eukprot:3692126-Prymnesium_polylepis.2